MQQHSPAAAMPPVEVKVWGPMACFTRPEAMAERVSYEIPTPSAARGMLEAIYWHRPMRWRVREIVVLKPILHFSLLRNEVRSRMSERTGGLDIADDRTQRHTLGLRDVAYIVRADVWLPPGAEPHDHVKHRDQFRRRVTAGQCFHRPYLGCREFAADFGEPNAATDKPVEVSADLGRMLLDFAYGRNGRSGNAPRFFNARLENGVLRVPNAVYDALYADEVGGVGDTNTAEAEEPQP